jgi:hypothetical protein
VKIRCRKRRTLASQARQSTASQSRVTSSGPFTATFVAASNLSLGLGVLVIFLFTGSPDRVSALSGPGTRPGIRPVIRDGRPEGPAIVSRFPVAFRLPAFVLLGHPIPAGELGLPYGWLTGPDRPDPVGVTAFRTHELRPGWEPPLPRGRRCSSRLSVLLNRRLPLHSGQSLYSATTSHRAGLFFTRHQRGFTRFSRPIFPSPVALGWNKSP